MTARFSRRLAAIRAGAFFGIIVTFCLVVLLPMSLDGILGMHLAKAWGLGELAAPLCLAGAIPGAAFAARPLRRAA
jgi:ABC-type molybdate transport system permease subunit